MCKKKYKSVFINCQEILCHAALEVLRVYYLKQSHILTTLGKKPLENIVRKGEHAEYQHFLLFPQCFLLYDDKSLSHSGHL